MQGLASFALDYEFWASTIRGNTHDAFGFGVQNHVVYAPVHPEGIRGCTQGHRYPTTNRNPLNLLVAQRVIREPLAVG